MILTLAISKNGVSWAIEMSSSSSLLALLMTFSSSANTWARPEKPTAMVLANSSATPGRNSSAGFLTTSRALGFCSARSSLKCSGMTSMADALPFFISFSPSASLHQSSPGTSP